MKTTISSELEGIFGLICEFDVKMEKRILLYTQNRSKKISSRKSQNFVRILIWIIEQNSNQNFGL